MPMTVAEADAVSKLVRFIVSGELYAGQPESAATTAAKLVYLAARAEKILQLNLPGDEATYAARLEALAAETTDTPETCVRCANHDPRDRRDHGHVSFAEATRASETLPDLRRALKEIDEIHIEWGGTDMDEINQLELWERLGRILRKAGV